MKIINYLDRQTVRNEKLIHRQRSPSIQPDRKNTQKNSSVSQWFYQPPKGYEFRVTKTTKNYLNITEFSKDGYLQERLATVKLANG